MKKKLLLALIFALSSAMAWSAVKEERPIEYESLFAWAEKAYPLLFAPAGSPTEKFQQYHIRYYKDTGNYLGVSQGMVFGYGPAFSKFENIGGGIRLVGSLEDFSNSISVSGVKPEGGFLVVNEVVAKDPDGGPDWFEIYAAGTEAVSLNGYAVSDGKNDREPVQLPNITLASGEYLIILATDEANTSGYSVPFKLGSNDRLQLYFNGTLVDDLDWDDGEAAAGYSFGRYPAPFSKGKTLIPTPGTKNKETEASLDALTGFGAVGPMLSSQVHKVSFNLDLDEYELMVNTYASTREKSWLEVNMSIDDIFYESVGIRLKGNSSLMGISSTEDPAKAPWLVKLDKFIEGQDHEGLEEFVIRSNNSRTSMNEAVALELLEEAGLATQDAVATILTVNDGTPVLRLVIEHPDDEWMKEEFDASGALYKSESTGNYSYRGDDPLEYEEVFEQKAGKANADLTPLIAFLKFINESDDDTFKAGLADRLDVDRFAIYLAMQDLVNNFDDIDGPGNNSYLYYDTQKGQFTIVPWDYNLAFGGIGGGGIGGGGFPGGPPGIDPGEGGLPGIGVVPESGVPELAGDLTSPPGRGGIGGGIPVDPGNLPTGGAFPDFGDFPEGGFGGPGGIGGPGGFGGGNILVQRFLADEEWTALYEGHLESLRATLYESGQAMEILKAWSDLVRSTGVISEEQIAAEAESISQYFLATGVNDATGF